MNQEAAQALVDANYELELYEGYSGRGMFGKETTGVTGSQSDYDEAIATIMEDGEEEERSEVAKALRGVRTDNMGRDIIWY